MADKKDAKIIPFPKKSATGKPNKSTAQAPTGTAKVQVSTKDPWAGNKQNMFFTVFGVMLIVSLVYNQVSYNSKSNSDRGIASEGGVQQNTEHESLMAKRLENLKGVDSIQAGRKPSSLDEFAFGTLAGKYALQFENGKVSQVEFVGSNTTEPNVEKAQLLTDPQSFLNENKSMFFVSFERAQESTDRNIAQQPSEKTFALYNGSTVVGYAKFEVDSEGRLLKLHLTKAE